MAEPPAWRNRLLPSLTILFSSSLYLTWMEVENWVRVGQTDSVSSPRFHSKLTRVPFFTFDRRLCFSLYNKRNHHTNRLVNSKRHHNNSLDLCLHLARLWRRRFWRMGEADDGGIARKWWIKFKDESVFAKYTPFFVCLASGSLNCDTFMHFISQDVHFLKAFALA